MFNVMMTSWGGTEYVLLESVSYDEALRFCEDNNWVWDTGYIWDLEIEEAD